MRNIVPLSKGIPAWFKIENYKGASELDALGWYANLSQRWNSLNTIETAKCDEVSNKRLESIKGDLELRANNPVRTYDQVIGSAKKPHQFSGLFTSSVSSLRNFDLIHLSHENNAQVLINALNAWIEGKQIEEQQRLLSMPYDIWAGSFFNAAVKVDLDAPDEQIQHDFKTWLTAARKAFFSMGAPKKRFTQADFDEWTKYGILPYLDLTIWRKTCNIKLTNAVIGRAIFPDNSECPDPTERIRRTTKEMTEYLISYGVLNALIVQARHEYQSF